MSQFRLNRLIFLIPFVGALLVYRFTLAPTISPEDGGELAAAAYTMGIPHPTGYPLWTLLAKVFITLVPFGEVAWRVSLFSAVLGAATAGIVSTLVYAWTRHFSASVSAGLALAFSFEFWEQSVIAEVYTLNAFLIAAILRLLYEWARTGRSTTLIWVSLFFGFGLGNHQTILLLAPPFAAYAYLVRPEGRPVGRLALFCAFTAITAAISIHLYLPFRAAADPAMNWGAPDSWSRFMDVVTRAQFQGMVTDRPRGLGRFLAQSGVFFRTAFSQYTPWVGLIVLAGVVVGWRSRRLDTLLLLVCSVIVAVGAILVPNFHLDSGWIWLNTPFWIPVYLFGAIFLGLALAKVRNRNASITLSVIVVLSPLVAHLSHNNMNDYRFARDYAENLLDTMPPDAVYFGTGDHTLFPLLYLQIVEGQRPDVLIANPYGYPPVENYAAMPDEFRARFTRHPHTVDEDAVFQWWLENSDRPVYSPIRMDSGSRRVVHAGLLYAYLHRSQEFVPVDWNSYAWNTIETEAAGDDWFAHNILYEVYLARARDEFERNENPAALDSLSIAAGLLYDDSDAQNNAGALCATHREYEAALAYFQAAVALSPKQRESRLNAARALHRLKRNDEAAVLLETWLEDHAADSDAQELYEKVRRGTNPTPDV